MVRRLAFSLLLLLTTVVFVPATVLFAPSPAQAATTALRFVDIPGDGVNLKATVIAPAAAGRHPAIIFPSSWGLNDLEYVAQAAKLAARGYVVVSYTPRGWWLSGGEIDTAGPRDRADLSKVIDWAVTTTGADPQRIGAAGVSYGAGISLLGSAFDPRIRAVGVLSGWTDLNYSLSGDQTRHRQSAGLLQVAAQAVGNPGPELSGNLADFFAGRNTEQVAAWAAQRSAVTYLDQLNTNRPAVLIANAWGDSFFPPNQLTGFFTALAGPKRLELRPGDHAIAELTGLAGLPNDVWAGLSRWFDQYLAGVDTGVPAEPPVVVKPWNAGIEQYATWSALAGSTSRLGLGAIRTLEGTGLLGGAPAASLTKSLPTGRDTVANGGVVLLTNGAGAFTGLRPTIWLPAVDRSRAGVWAGVRPSAVQRVRGTPRLHLNLIGTQRTGTVVAYLYDLDAVGTATLITHAPVSWTGTSAGDRTVDVDLWATAYDVPAGHAVTLVVDTVDPLYFDENESGRTVTVGGGSYLDLPLK
ncbi:CocE/NonD family hydrolase [Actinoplanes sp. TFC3]|uniref:CocE/NonD family hydrolase n=1 Tax=Actinoplanes sp. TFC3 TaxID=1710355 RepID=UPI0009EBED6F|nr:CocE/NonD family hydrolase [Actinoplanes sp. TFC3]